MGGDAFTFELFGLTFNWTNLISGTVVFVLTFCLLVALSRKLQMKPTGGQNALEWLIEFTNGIARGQLNAEVSSYYSFFVFVLFVFIFIANQLGLIFQIGWGGHELVKSPTADPVITMTLSLCAITLAHFAGVAGQGIKGYFKDYFQPFALMFPIKLVEEFSNFLTLGLRLFGNIYAGELLLSLIAKMAFSHGLLTIVVSLPLEMAWQGFSVFIGAIQAYVFVTLTTVYISRKVSGE